MHAGVNNANPLIKNLSRLLSKNLGSFMRGKHEQAMFVVKAYQIIWK